MTITQAPAFAACFAHSLAASAPAGTLFEWGKNTAGELASGQTTGTILSPIPVPGMSNVIDIACRLNGSPFNIDVASGGQAWGWGHNEFGQLGDETTVDRTAPVAVQGLNLS